MTRSADNALRGEVVHRAEDESCRVLLLSSPDCRRNAEVEDLRGCLGHHHVIWLYVAVDQTARVGVSQGLGHLGTDPQSEAGLHRPERGQLTQGHARQEFHHHERHRVTRRLQRLTVVVDLCHVRVRQTGHRARLGPDAGKRQCAAYARQHFDRDFAAENQVPSSPNHRHPARTETVHQLVPVDQNLP